MLQLVNTQEKQIIKFTNQLNLTIKEICIKAIEATKNIKQSAKTQGLK